jgi:hypothetical protein
VDPPPPPTTAATGTLAVTPASPPARAPSPPPTSRPAPSADLESSHAATCCGMKQNILVKDLKILISMCRSNDALIRESHQQMSQRHSTLEERQCEVHASMGLETLDHVVYPPLPPPVVEDPWAWYRTAEGNDDDEIEEESE